VDCRDVHEVEGLEANAAVDLVNGPSVHLIYNVLLLLSFIFLSILTNLPNYEPTESESKSSSTNEKEDIVKPRKEV
jgi:hypothetical protein